MQSYQTRVRDELTSLEDKAKTLYSYLASDSFTNLDKANQELLKQQYYIMMVYAGTLQQRIDRFA